jgi:hypothetical protein
MRFVFNVATRSCNCNSIAKLFLYNAALLHCRLQLQQTLLIERSSVAAGEK